MHNAKTNEMYSAIFSTKVQSTLEILSTMETIIPTYTLRPLFLNTLYIQIYAYMCLARDGTKLCSKPIKNRHCHLAI